LWVKTEEHFKKPVQLLVNNAGVSHHAGWKKCMEIDIVREIIDLTE